MTHTEIQAELSAFALGALDAPEKQSVEAHLAAGCDECVRELDRWRLVVGALGLAASSTDGPDLKRRLLQQATRRPNAPMGTLPVTRWPWALAAGLLLILAGARETYWRHELAQQSEARATLQRELQTASISLESLRTALAAKERDATELRAALAATEQDLAIVRERGLQMVRLAQTADAKPAEAHVLFSPSSGRALFYAFELAPLSAPKTYELWWITEKAGPINAGLFVPDARGLAKLEPQVPRDAGTIQAAAVTVEPAGGVAQPTGPMILLGKL